MSTFYFPVSGSDSEPLDKFDDCGDFLDAQAQIVKIQAFQPEQFLILAVDDAADNLQILGHALDQAGYGTTFASSGAQALERIPQTQPDLIVLDLMMPGISGLEVCQHLKKSPDTRQIPIIFLTASNDKRHLLDAFAYGAVDYITKPFNTPELLARVKTHLELKHSRDLLKQAIAQLESLAKTDPLTKVANRRHWVTTAQQELKRTQRYGCPFSILLIDLDHFKRINDTYGHHGGDQVLITTVEVMQQILRQQDTLGRWGGEEFVVLLPETPLKAAITVAERLRMAIEKRVNHPPPDQIYTCTTLSVGITTCGARDMTLDSIIQRADKALYEAKERGRNQGIAIAPPQHLHSPLQRSNPLETLE